MRYYTLLNFQHMMLYIFPTLILIVLLAVALGYMCFWRSDNEKRMHQIIGRFPGDIKERSAPFPLIMTLVIVGTVLWALGYILGYGILGVKL